MKPRQIVALFALALVLMYVSGLYINVPLLALAVLLLCVAVLL
jgi:hypothetical protein